MLVLLLLVADLAGLVTLLGSAYDAVAIVVFPLLWGIGLMLATAGSPKEERSASSRLFTISFLLRVGVAIAIYRFGIVGRVHSRITPCRARFEAEVCRSGDRRRRSLQDRD